VLNEGTDISSISELKLGDIIRRKSESDCYMVTHIYGSYVTAVRIVGVQNLPDWRLLARTTR